MYHSNQLQVAVLLEPESLVIAARPGLVGCLADGPAVCTLPHLASDVLVTRMHPQIGPRIENLARVWLNYPFVKSHTRRHQELTTTTP